MLRRSVALGLAGRRVASPGPRILSGRGVLALTKMKVAQVRGNAFKQFLDPDDQDDLPDFLKDPAPKGKTGQSKGSTAVDMDDSELPSFLRTPPAGVKPERYRNRGTSYVDPVEEPKSPPRRLRDDAPFGASEQDDGADDLPPFLRGITESPEAQKGSAPPPDDPSDPDADLPPFLRGLSAGSGQTRTGGRGAQDVTGDAAGNQGSRTPPPPPAPPPPPQRGGPPPGPSRHEERRPRASREEAEEEVDLQVTSTGRVKVGAQSSQLPDFLSVPPDSKRDRPSRPPPRQRSEPPLAGPTYKSTVDAEAVGTALSREDATAGLRVLDKLTCETISSDSWQGARATDAAQPGERVAFATKSLWGKLYRVGWSTSGSTLYLGSDENGVGYGATGKKSSNDEFDNYGINFQAGDTVVCLANLGAEGVDAYSVSYIVNGKHQGVAWRIPKKLQSVPFYPHVLTKSARVRLYFGEQADQERWPSARDLPAGYRWLSASVEDRATDRDVDEEPEPAAPEPAAPKPAAAPAAPGLEDLLSQIQDPALAAQLKAKFSALQGDEPPRAAPAPERVETPRRPERRPSREGRQPDTRPDSRPSKEQLPESLRQDPLKEDGLPEEFASVRRNDASEDFGFPFGGAGGRTRPARQEPTPKRTCALCGQQREAGVMEDWGRGSGFYQCTRGAENDECAPERLARARKQVTPAAREKPAAREPVAQQRRKTAPEVQGGAHANRALKEGMAHVERMQQSTTRSWRARLAASEGKEPTSWKDRSDERQTEGGAAPMRRCADCWELQPESKLERISEGSGWRCHESEPPPCGHSREKLRAVARATGAAAGGSDARRRITGALGVPEQGQGTAGMVSW
eukprot:Hpha_TRINITY_DN13754_c0_g2::TRINITY_DN13754_c0_g2_i1::g.142766::m.142766